MFGHWGVQGGSGVCCSDFRRVYAYSLRSPQQSHRLLCASSNMDLIFFCFRGICAFGLTAVLRGAHWQTTLHSSPRREYLPSQWTTALAVVGPAANEAHQLA